MSKNIKVVLGLSCEDMASFLKENSGSYPEIPLKIQDYNTPDETYQILSSEFDCSRYTAFLDMINRFRKAHLSFFFQKDETGKIEGVIFPAAKSGKSLLTKEIDDSILSMLRLEHIRKEDR